MTARLRRNTQIICGRNTCRGSADMNKAIDFKNCRRMPGRAYNGANGKKIAVEFEGKQYMLKFPPSGEGKAMELS